MRDAHNPREQQKRQSTILSIAFVINYTAEKDLG